MWRKWFLCKCGCGEKITLDKYGHRVYYIKGHRIREHCNSWKGGRVYDNRGYVKLYLPDHPQSDAKGYIYEHRIIMEQHLGRPLTKEEAVHHLNGIKDDNRIENLELHTKSSHQSKHQKIFRENVVMKRVCSVCGSNKTYYEEKTNHYSWYFDKITKLPVCGRCNTRLRYPAKHRYQTKRLQEPCTQDLVV